MEVFYFAGVFEAALLSGFTQGSEYLSLWIAFLDYLRRRINWDKGKLLKLITDALVIIRISLYAVCFPPNKCTHWRYKQCILSNKSVLFCMLTCGNLNGSKNCFGIVLNVLNVLRSSWHTEHKHQFCTSQKQIKEIKY